MKIAVLQFFNTPYRELAAITVPPVADYCRRRGYTHIVERVQARTDDAHMCWYKPELLLHHLPNYDWVFYLDVDATITNPECAIERIIMRVKSPDMVATFDANGFNAGVILLQNTAAMREALRGMLSTSDKTGQLSEQNAFVLARDACVVELADQSVMNAYIYSLYGDKYRGCPDWQPGDFILHLPGVDMKTRIQTFNSVLHGLPLI